MRSGDKRGIGVVYLAWHGLGCETFRRFAESYRLQPAGCEHDLIVVYAGFEQRQLLREARSVFRDILHVGIEFMDVKLDIGYYLETSRRVQYEYLCFLNTYTELLTPNWLAHLHTHAALESVGIVGAAASYESLYATLGLYHKINWLRHTSGYKISERTAYYYDFLITASGPDAVIEPEVQLPSRRLERIIAQAARYVKQREQDIGFENYWGTLTSPNNALAEYRRFPAFPNPHIRSNGFMVRRSRLASFDSSKIQTKLDACAFESGADSLTTQLRRTGLAAIVVDRKGQGYNVPDWCRSGTFRLGNQPGLIMTDNRSREFAKMSPAMRIVHSRVTWGDYLGPAPADFPDFGYSFARRSLESAPREPNIRAPRTSDPKYVASKLALRILVALRGLKPALRRSGVVLLHRVRAGVRPIVRVAERPFKKARVASYARTIARRPAEIGSVRARSRSENERK
jgi:hypothetical protein